MSKNQEVKRKSLQQLTFKSNFMFAAVMMDPENAKGVLERILGFRIKSLKVCYEKSIIYNPEYKGVRLDVELEDENHTHYDVEMQVASVELIKRARYYHDQIDMELLLSGGEYEELPDTYVIFICDFDPIGLGKYRYIKKQVLEEDESFTYDDGQHTIFLSTKGTNEKEVPEELVKFLKFVGANLEDSRKDYEDTLIKRLQESVEKVKKDREMGRRYMTIEELMKDEFKAGKEEGIIESKIEDILSLLSDVEHVPENLQKRISSVTDTTILSELLKKAAGVKSIREFEIYLEQKNL